MKWTIRNKVIVIIVVVTIVAGSSVFGYLRYVDQNPYPGLATDNKVVNGTIAENFANYTDLQQIPKSVFVSITNLSYHNLRSNLTLQAVLFVYYDPYQRTVVATVNINVTGNVSSDVRPTGVQLAVTNTWSDNLGGMAVLGGSNDVWLGPWTGPIPPYTNVSKAQVNTQGASGSYPFQAKAGFKNQSSSEGVNRFGFGASLTYNYNTLSSYAGSSYGTDIGNQILHITASLQGLGQPVFVTLNVALQNSA